MSYDIKKILSSFCLTIAFLCVVCPCRGMEDDSHQIKMPQKQPLDPLAYFRTFIELQEEGCRLAENPLYKACSHLRTVGALWLNPEVGMFQAGTSVLKSFTPYLPGWANNTFSDLLYQYGTYCIYQNPQAYAAQKILGDLALFLLKETSCSDEVKALLYAAAECVGFHGDAIIHSAKTALDDLGKGNSLVQNREGFFTLAEGIQNKEPGQCSVLGKCSVAIKQKCKKPPLTCKQMEQETDLTPGVCQFFLPSLKTQWSKICIPIVEHLEGKNPKPLFIAFGEYHYDYIPSIMVVANTIEFLRKGDIDTKNIVFFRELAPGTKNEAYQWLGKKGVRIVDADINRDISNRLEKLENPLIYCGAWRGPREDGFVKTIKDSYLENRYQAGVGVFGSNHISGLAGRDFIQQNLNPLFYQLVGRQKMAPRYSLLDKRCSQKARQRFSLFQELDPTLPEISIRIDKIAPGTEEKLVRHLLNGDILLKTINRNVAEKISKRLPPTEMALANKALWFREYIKFVVEKDKYYFFLTKTAIDSEEIIRKRGGLYVGLVGILAAVRAHLSDEKLKNTPLIKIIEQPEKFLNHLSQTENSTIDEIIFNMISFEED